MMNYLMDGGWMMLPLLVCSIVLVAVIIDRHRAFGLAAKLDPKALREKVVKLLVDGDVVGASAACRESEGPVAAVLLAGLEKFARLYQKGKSEQEIEAGVTKAMEDYAPKAMSVLERRLGTLLLVSSIAPLLGMCGTVTGMINSFSVMAQAAGLDAGAVAGGISEALITTAAGLLIAIPGVVVYNMYQKRVEDWNVQLETTIAEFAQAIAP